MSIEELKQTIEKGNCPYHALIFDCSKSGTFIAEQYIKQIALLLNKDIVGIDDLSVVESVNDMFYVSDNNVHVYRTDNLEKLNYTDAELSDYLVYIIADKVEKTLKERSIYVALPELEEWCLKDLLFSCCEGADEDDLEKLFNLIKSNPFRAQQEIDRLSLFPSIERKYTLKSFLSDGIYDDLNTDTTFELVNAILHKDKKKIVVMLKNLDKMDINGFGLASLLYTQFRNVILVQLSKTKTAEVTGLPSNKIYAINKYSTGYYSKDQLLSIFKLLTDVPTMVKVGKLPAEEMINYIIIKIMLIGGIEYASK